MGQSHLKSEKSQQEWDISSATAILKRFNLIPNNFDANINHENSGALFSNQQSNNTSNKHKKQWTT